MSFTVPYALWGLIGLSIPIIIHLFSNREKNTVYFGSLRFLEASKSDAARSIHLSRYLLLLLRIVILTLICFFMARPFWSDISDSRIIWVEEGINLKDYDSFIDEELIEKLEPLFFTFDRDSIIESRYFHSAWSFIDYLNHQRDSAVVYSYSLQKNLSAHPVRLAPHIQWITLPVKESSSESGIIHKNQQSTEWEIDGNSEKLTLSARTHSNDTPGQVSPALNIRLIETSDNKQPEGLVHLIDLIKEYVPYHVNWSSDKEADWLILVGDTAYTGIEKFIQWIPANAPLEWETNSKYQYRLKGRIDQDELLRTNLPVIISSLLNRDYVDLDEFDERVFNENILFLADEVKVTGRHKSPEIIAMGLFWWLLIIPAVFAERLLSNKVKTN